VDATKKGRKGSSHVIDEIILLEPPMILSKGAIQQRDALAEVKMVISTVAFIQDLKLYYY
jgi:hypothetical protein